MKIYNKYIISLALLLTLTTVILSAFGQSQLEFYFTLYVIESLVLTELYVHLNPKARRGLSRVSLVLFVGFILIVAKKVIEILAGT